MTTEPGAFLEVTGLTVTREGRAIVEDIAFAVSRGGIHLIVGPNGGGKSTVIEAVLGQTSFRGSIDVRFRGARRVGYVPQSFPVDPTLPVTAGELLAASRQRWPVCLGLSASTRARVSDLLDRVGLGGLIDRRLGALSGGELRRVLLAHALDPAPELLVLDEPGSGLDTSSVERLEALVREVRDAHGTTILMVSHDHEQVRRLADGVTMIDRVVVRRGSPEAVLGSPREAA